MNAVDQHTNENIKKIAELESTAKSTNSWGERLSARIGKFCGSMSFVWLHVIGFSGWIYYNSASQFSHPDPFPFTFLSLIVSLEAIFLSTFILISQNQETELDKKRSRLDLQINLLTEQENTKMLRRLEQIATHVGVRVDDDPDAADLMETVQPERLVKQIDQQSE